MGAEEVEAIKGVEGEGDGGLEGGYAHWDECMLLVKESTPWG